MKLDQNQLEVARHFRGPCLVAAVAGSGKSTSIVYRIAYLIRKGVPASAILATTFTRRAAWELNEKLRKVGIKNIKISTFHSICYQILREDGKKFGGRWRVRGEFPISKGLLHSLKLPASTEEGGMRPADILNFIGWCKNWLLSSKAAAAEPEPIQQYMRINQIPPQYLKLLTKAYRRLEKYRKTAHFLTYDDILYQCHRLFVKKPEVLKKWHDRFKWIIVDEVQDNCFAQHEILRLLSSPENNAMIVGDLAQSIYSWRAALPRFMVEFEKTFALPEQPVKVLKIEYNYRSRPEITDIANRFLSHSQETLGTTIRPQRENGGTVYFRCYANPLDEAMAIAMEIKHGIRSGKDPADFAVICRVNRMMEDFQIAFTKLAIPFKVIGGMSLYEYKVSQDLLAYLQYARGVFRGLDDRDAFYRLINTPARGMGEKFIAKVMMESTKQEKTPIYKVAESIGGRTSGASSLASLIDRCVDLIKAKRGPSDILKYVALTTGYVDKMGSRDEKYKKFLSDKITTLCLSAAQYKTTKSFLHHVEEVMLSGGEEEKDNTEDKDKVIIITVHRSKGLEFPTVYVPQMTAERFPHARAVASGMVEEERRLAYVAITRAKDHLRLSTTSNTNPSPFIEDMGLMKSSLDMMTI